MGRCESNLDDLGLAFQDLNVDINDLEEYVRNVDPVPCVINPPKLPVHRESHLNFLKPGSREVLRRPIHIQEHLPPMYPDKEGETYRLNILYKVEKNWKTKKSAIFNQDRQDRLYLLIICD